MSVIEELIRCEEDGTISFGNYLMDTKTKVNDFDVDGDLYKVKTFCEITKLEKNGKMVMETVPGATVHHFLTGDRGATFSVEAAEDVQVTLEMEPDEEYKILLDNVNVGKVKTNMAGKVNFSIEMQNKPVSVKIERV